jgi:hypothetical protein
MNFMASKIGCAPMAAFLLILLILIGLGSNEAIGYYFSHCENENILECLFAGLDEPEPKGVVATGTYDYKGNSVTITANIPLEGGAVTGSVSGACEGTVKATYDGQQNGAISGRMSGVCSPFFVNIPASADFNGSVNKTSKTVPFRFTGKGAGITHEGAMALTYQ